MHPRLQRHRDLRLVPIHGILGRSAFLKFFVTHRDFSPDSCRGRAVRSHERVKVEPQHLTHAAGAPCRLVLRVIISCVLLTHIVTIIFPLDLAIIVEVFLEDLFFVVDTFVLFGSDSRREATRATTTTATASAAPVSSSATTTPTAGPTPSAGAASASRSPTSCGWSAGWNRAPWWRDSRDGFGLDLEVMFAEVASTTTDQIRILRVSERTRRP